MALIPLNQEIKIYRSTGELDRWGNPIQSEPFRLKCRVSEESKLMRVRAGDGSGTSGVEIVTYKIRILLDGIADIQYDDDIEYTDELGRVLRGKPKEIVVRRLISGKPVMTEVFI